MKLTASQWEAAREVRRHVLVTAGAGTGKTRTVVGRILYLLGADLNGERIDRPLTLRDLAAITFTNHAAADLKSKLRHALREAGLARDAYLVDTARIGTIHNFCGDVLREFALRTGGNPREEILDEVSRGAMAADIVRDTLLQGMRDEQIDDLSDLLATWSVRDVLRFVMTLLADLDRLDTYCSHRADLDPPERALVDLATQAASTMDQRLDERGAIDFDRLILRARDLLRSDAGVLEALQRRLRMLIVDEFQDVDPAQKEIAYLLGDPRSDRTDSTRLLLVGDPKQSIYRFRRADITVWRDVERDFRTGRHGRVITLAESFRSAPPVLGFVDASVGKILGAPAEGTSHADYEVPFESLRVATPTESESAPRVELIVIPLRADGRDYRVTELRRIEAMAVARRARELVDTGETTWGQMAVLMPTWSLMPLYDDAFARVGTEAYALRSAGFYERREVVDMIGALEAVRDPTDDRALVGFLRGPFVGVRDETLLAMARRSTPPYWLSADALDVPERDLLRWGLSVVRRHADMRDRVPIDELLDSLLDETGYVAHLRLAGAGRSQAIGNVDKFLRHARAASRSSVSDFLRMIQEARAREGDEGEVPLVPRTDAVTLSTVHSAKGLEWDVVFWSDLVRRVTGGEDRDLLIGRTHVALRDPDAAPTDQPEPWQRVRAELESEALAERKRLWYVAATRAAQRLIVTGLPAGAMRAGRTLTGADYLWQALGPIPVIDGALFSYESASGISYDATIRVADASVLDAPDEELPTAPAVASLDSIPGPLSPIAVRSDRPVHSASELLQHSRCQRKHWFTHVMGVREPPVDRTSPDFVNAVARGHIVHDVLQSLEAEDELDGLLEDAIGRWDPFAPAPDQPEGKRYRAHLRTEITNVAHHPDYRAIADLPTARRELRFLHVAGEDASFVGDIDLAAGEGSALVLLDVKTSRGDASVLRQRAEHYRSQRDVYVTSVEAVAGMPVHRFAFQFSAAALQVSDELDDEARAAIRGELRETVDAMGSGTPALTTHPAECRFCGFCKVGWCPGVAEPVARTTDGAAQLTLGLD